MKRKLTAAFLLMLFLLVGAEVVVRVFFARNMAGRFDYGYHPDAGFVEEGDKLKLVRAGGRRFFPQEMKLKPEAGTFRIFVIGDSVPRGPGLEKAYAYQLQEILKTNGVKAEAYNLCVPGYGAQRKQIVLSKALEYQPDLVILHLNASNEYEDEREYKRSKEFDGWHPKNWLMKSLIIRRLHEAKTEKAFWHLLPTEVRQQGAINDADAEIAAGQNEATRKRWLEQVKQWTATSVQTAQDKKVPILLVSQAVCENMKDRTQPLDDQGLDAVAESFRGVSVYHLSMKEVLTGGDYATLYSDGSHMRPDGHRTVAEALARFMTTNGVVKPGS
ncbi:MAG TPA: SGNH/GDSL hydrolase family protein [Verrucomicrobiae bacterium]